MKTICRYYHLPEWVALGDYKAIAKDLGFQQPKDTDWTVRSGLGARGLSFGCAPRSSMTLSSKVHVPDIITFGALCGANLVT